MNLRKTIASLLIISLLPVLSSCSSKKDENADSGAYSCSVFEIPVKDSYEDILKGVYMDGNDVCIPVEYAKYDEDGILLDGYTEIYTVDDKGTVINSLELRGNLVPSAVLDDVYACFSARGNAGTADYQVSVLLVDKKTGNTVRSIEPSFVPYEITALSDGFAVSGETGCACYTKDGDLVGSLSTDFNLYMDGEAFFEDKGKYYVIEDKDTGTLVYHEADINSGICKALAGSSDIGISGRSVEGKYFFNPDGEYKIDLANMKVDRLAEWNNIDIRPPQKNLDTPAKHYRLDDERFAISYEYRDKTSEVLIFRYDPTIDRMGQEKIKIGGYGVYDDPVLLWTVYTYNTTNKKSRVILEDYGQQFEAETPADWSRSLLALSKYFNEGNTPDIYYGTRFDYNYMGKCGTVVDLSDYLNRTDGSIQVMTEAASNLMTGGKGKCYQVFSGYTMYGYSAQEKVLAGLQDTSFASLYKYAKDNDIVYSTADAADIVDTAIRYDLADLWGVYDGKRKLSKEKLTEIVSCALSIPVSQQKFLSEEDVIKGKALICNAEVDSIISEDRYKDEFRFIGYPSVEGSVCLAIPECCLAVSSAAKDREECLKVLSELFSEDAQKQTIISGNIPVTESAMDLLTEISMHPQAVDDKTLKGFAEQFDPVDQDAVDHFKQKISMANTLATYDWGIYDIILEEINSYYSQNRTPDQIATSLDNRLTLYVQENYM